MGTVRPGRFGLALLVLAGCLPEPDAPVRQANGEAFGTSWSVRARGEGPDLRTLVLPVLDRVDRSMSNWRADSEISRLNRADAATVPVSEELARVLDTALRVHRESGGAFDVTVAPLLALWGFGPRGNPEGPPPGEAEIENVRRRVGSGRLTLSGWPSGAPEINRDTPGVEIDLSGIAKGYAADAVHAALREAGSREHLVEIGGEIRMAGGWRIGIEAPRAGLTPVVARSFRLHDLGVATSGGYRDFRDTAGGGYLTHILDPRAGRSVSRQAGSVTVLAESALAADAWATALYVLGPGEGGAVAERLDLAALFLTLTPSGALRERRTPAFDERLRGSLR